MTPLLNLHIVSMDDDLRFNTDVYRQLLLIPDFPTSFPEVLLVLISQYIKPPTICLVSYAAPWLKHGFEFISPSWSRRLDNTTMSGVIWEHRNSDPYSSSFPYQNPLEIVHHPMIKYKDEVILLQHGSIYHTNLKTRVMRAMSLPLFCSSHGWSAAQIGDLWYIVHQKGYGWVYDLQNRTSSHFPLPQCQHPPLYYSRIHSLEEEGLLLLFIFVEKTCWMMSQYNPVIKIWTNPTPTSLPYNSAILYTPIPRHPFPKIDLPPNYCYGSVIKLIIPFMIEKPIPVSQFGKMMCRLKNKESFQFMLSDRTCTK